ncbi:MAG: DUF2079 domain-containing protein [Deltaproteobacteria bacterium]|nr:DUF2079 domain-containing protein [Deltaproteobacteria bacterium]
MTRALGASLREAFGDDGSIGTDARRVIGAVSGSMGVVIFALAWQRYATFHNRNFDLAFYARLAWGESHGDPWEPLLDAHVWGLHFVWVLEILGWIGRVVGQVRTLLIAQSLAVALATWPIARMAARIYAPWSRADALGPIARRAPVIAALVWLLQPNLWHVATCDFHPGTLAVLPLAWCCESLHRRSAHGLVWSSLGVLACREDLGLVVAFFGLALALASRRGALLERRIGAGLALGSLAYVGLFLGVFHPRYAPTNGSFVQHFAAWGEGPTDAIVTVIAHPLRLFEWLLSAERAPYLLVVTAPLAFLAFLAPEWLLLAAPILGMNLLSSFPTTLFLDSHYLTPALPIVVSASLVGGARIASIGRGLSREIALAPLLVCAVIAHVLEGGSPLSLRYDRLAYVDDATTDALRDALAAIPDEASVQAPERVLAHLAERRRLRRGPPPETLSDYVIFDAWQRRLEAHREELLRTEEEPLVRDWLARDDHALVFSRDAIYVLARGGRREGDVASAHVVGHADPDEGRALTACLALLDASVAPRDDGSATLTLELAARGPCASDLALRVGWGHRPRRVDLIADGDLSPARFSAGDRIRSMHALSSDELEAIEAHGLRIGAVRQSGARPDPGDPPAIDVGR